MDTKRVGIVGVGLLGTAISKRLASQGFEVFGFDVDPAFRQRAPSIQAVDSLAELSSKCKRIVLCLPNSDIVATVVEQILANADRVKSIVDTTTGDPQDTVKTAQKLAEHSISYLDATVAGSSELAHRGEVVLMVGGNAAELDSHRDLLDAFSWQVFHVGPAGSGATMKLIVNLVLGLNRAVLAEGLALAAKSGVDQSMALDVLKSGAAYSKAMDLKGEKMTNEEFAPQAKLSQHLKDVGLILSLAQRAGAKVPLSDLHRQLLRQAEELGLGEADNSAIIKVFD